MAQHHTDPARETDIHALPDLEVFYLSHDEARQHAHCGDEPRDDDDPENLAGWYYWWCLPWMPAGFGPVRTVPVRAGGRARCARECRILDPALH